LGNFREDINSRSYPFLDIFGVRLSNLSQILDLCWVLDNRDQLRSELVLLDNFNLWLGEDLVLANLVQRFVLFFYIDWTAWYILIIYFLRHLFQFLEDVLLVLRLYITVLVFLEEGILNISLPVLTFYGFLLFLLLRGVIRLSSFFLRRLAILKY